MEEVPGINVSTFWLKRPLGSVSGGVVLLASVNYFVRLQAGVA